MARGRSSLGTATANPLQRMFGAYLRVERSRYGLSSGDIALRLGLSETYYRLVESGRAALNQALVLEIVAVFSGNRSGTGRRSINLARLSLLLVGANWVGTEMASAENKNDAGKLALLALAEQVAEFEQLIAQTIGLLDKAEGSQEQRRFLEDIVAPEISDFLTLEGDMQLGRQSDGSLKFLNTAPTLNIDFIMEVNQSLEWRPFVHAANVAADWETRRANAFRGLHGVYSDPGGIISESNLNLFQFDYLFERGFLRLQFVFVNGGTIADAAAAGQLEHEKRSAFISILNKARVARSRKAFTEKEAEKIAFRFLTDEERQGIARKNVNAILGPQTNYCGAYWSFDMIAGFPIAFLGLLDGRPDRTVNLNLNEANAKGAAFDELWNKIEQSRQSKGQADKFDPG